MKKLRHKIPEASNSLRLLKELNNHIDGKMSEDYVHKIGIIVSNLIGDMNVVIELKSILMTQFRLNVREDANYIENKVLQVNKTHNSMNLSLMEESYKRIIEFYKDSLSSLNIAYGDEQAKSDWIEKNARKSNKVHKQISD